MITCLLVHIALTIRNIVSYCNFVSESSCSWLQGQWCIIEFDTQEAAETCLAAAPEIFKLDGDRESNCFLISKIPLQITVCILKVFFLPWSYKSLSSFSTKLHVYQLL